MIFFFVEVFFGVFFGNGSDGNGILFGFLVVNFSFVLVFIIVFVC